MRKCLLFVALLIVSQVNSLFAQDLFEAPDTVCVRQFVNLKSNKPNAATHYWGFCSAYMFNKPNGVNVGNILPAGNEPTAIEIAKDGDTYYGFVVCATTRSFLRLDFGNSLTNVPVVTDYNNMDSVLPASPSSLYIFKDDADSTWHIYVSGGTNVGESSIARIDYGKSLKTVPNIVNFGNYNNVLDQPVGIFVGKQGSNYWGYVLNKNTSTLVRLSFGTNASYTPLATDLGNCGNTLFVPSDMAAVKHNGLWYFFVTDELTNAVTRIDIDSLSNSNPSGTLINGAVLGNELDGPSSLTILRDCDSFNVFITNKTTHELVRMEMASVTGPYSATNMSKLGGILTPTGLSQFMRDHDNIYAYVANSGDFTFTRLSFDQCVNTTIGYSTTNKPPAYYYDTAGVFNIYYAINEGMPDMEVRCKLINVIPIPSIIMPDDTVICQGDTIQLQIVSVNAQSFSWRPNYNISATNKNTVTVWPAYTTEYRIVLPYITGCVVDTSIRVDVHKIKADAGPDRIIHDGAATILGGPLTSYGPQYSYQWTPDQYMNNALVLNPEVKPPHDFTYYLTLKDTAGCAAIDTVIVRVDCNDINLPNAFMPESAGANAKFGLANSQLIKLNSFTIYDRWGLQVFTTTDPTKEWDGKVNGEPAAVGVYVWEADGFCISGKRFTRSGNVTLIR